MEDNLQMTSVASQKTSRRNKDTLLKKIQSEHHLLDSELARLEPDDWLEIGVVGNWNAKDLLAHLTAWESLFCNWYMSGLNGENGAITAPGYSRSEIDHINEKIYLSNRDRPLDQIQTDFGASYKETFELIQSIPEEDIFTPGRFRWTGKILLEDYIVANMSNHYHWARYKIRHWQEINRSSQEKTTLKE